MPRSCSLMPTGENPFAAFAFKATPRRSLMLAAVSSSAAPTKSDSSLQKHATVPAPRGGGGEGDESRADGLNETRDISRADRNSCSEDVSMLSSLPTSSSAPLAPKWSRAPVETPSQERLARSKSQGSVLLAKATRKGSNGSACTAERISSSEESCPERQSEESGSDDGSQEKEGATGRAEDDGAEGKAGLEKKRPCRGESQGNPLRARGRVLTHAVSRSFRVLLQRFFFPSNLCSLLFVPFQSSPTATLSETLPLTMEAVPDRRPARNGVGLWRRRVLRTMGAAQVFQDRARALLRENGPRFWPKKTVVEDTAQARQGFSRERKTREFQPRPGNLIFLPPPSMGG